MTDYFTTIESPVGELLLAGDGRSLSRLQMRTEATALAIDSRWRREPGAFSVARRQLREYFVGTRHRFELALAPAGSPFELRVWEALQEIPYGQTITYGEIAQAIGHPGAARAVGRANGRNPIAVIIPCHRVIGAGGDLTGYAAGLAQKRRLLDLEAGVLTLTARSAA